MKIKIIVGFLLFCFNVLNIFAQNTDWTISLDAAYQDGVYAIKTDNDSNVIITGALTGSTNMNPLYLPDSVNIPDGSNYGFVAKYDSTGNLIWYFVLDGPFRGSDIFIDSQNSILISGVAAVNVDFDPGTEVHSSTLDGACVVKYSSDGTFVFLKQYNAGTIESLVCDQNDNLYYFVNENNLLIKCDGSGNVLNSKSVSIQTVSDIVVDLYGNVFLCGYYGIPVDFDPGAPVVNPDFDGDYDGVLIKYDSLFNYLWHSRIFCNGSDYLFSVVADSNGSMYVSGFSSETSVYVATPFDTTTIASFGWAAPLLKFDQTGHLTDYRLIGSSIDMNTAFNLSLDESNNLYIGGLYNNSFYPGENLSGKIIEPFGNGDLYYLKLNSDLDYIWGFGIGGPGYEMPGKLSVGAGNLYFCGSFTQMVDFDNADSVSDFHNANNEGGFLQKVNLTSFIDTTTFALPYVNNDIVLDINTNGNSSPMYLFVDSLSLFFIANDGINGYELWKTDGSDSGTVMIKDINIAGDGFLYDPDYIYATVDPTFTKVGNEIFFIAYTVDEGMELWKTDGTTTGTQMVIDLYPGSGSSMGFWSFMCELNSTLYFFAKTPTSGVELWKSDGTAAGTTIVKDIYPGSADGVLTWLTKCGNNLIFPANDGVSGVELWKSDGTAAGTAIITELAAGSASVYPQSLVACGNKVFFTMTDPLLSDNVGVTDGTAAGTHLVKDINLSGPTNPYLLFPHGNNCFFFANDDMDNWELWYSDGTETGTVKVKEINPTGSALDYNAGVWTDQVSLGNFMYFSANNGTNGMELWRSDGTTAGTTMVKDVYAGCYGGAIYEFAVSDTTIFFSGMDESGYQLWRTNGSDSSTIRLRALNPHGSGYPDNLVFMNGYVFFDAADPVLGYELWKYKLVDSLAITAIDSTRSFSELKSGEILQLQTSVFPSSATDNTIIWKIVQGNEMAEIDQSGQLLITATLIPSDTIFVEALADDGSFKSCQIPVTLSLINNVPSVENSFSVFPNPTSDYIYIKTEFDNIAINISISDITGRVIFEQNFTNTKPKINVSEFERGTYIISLKTSEKITSAMFVKQ